VCSEQKTDQTGIEASGKVPVFPLKPLAKSIDRPFLTDIPLHVPYKPPLSPAGLVL
jgi:hypothetical protein